MSKVTKPKSKAHVDATPVDPLDAAQKSAGKFDQAYGKLSRFVGRSDVKNILRELADLIEAAESACAAMKSALHGTAGVHPDTLSLNLKNCTVTRAKPSVSVTYNLEDLPDAVTELPDVVRTVTTTVVDHDKVTALLSLNILDETETAQVLAASVRTVGTPAVTAPGMPASKALRKLLPAD